MQQCGRNLFTNEYSCGTANRSLKSRSGATLEAGLGARYDVRFSRRRSAGRFEGSILMPVYLELSYLAHLWQRPATDPGATSDAASTAGRLDLLVTSGGLGLMF
jgi:hypothetical protein